MSLLLLAHLMSGSITQYFFLVEPFFWRMVKWNTCHLSGMVIAKADASIAKKQELHLGLELNGALVSHCRHGFSWLLNPAPFFPRNPGVAKLVKLWQVCWDEKLASFLLTVSLANDIFFCWFLCIWGAWMTSVILAHNKTWYAYRCDNYQSTLHIVIFTNDMCIDTNLYIYIYTHCVCVRCKLANIIYSMGTGAVLYTLSRLACQISCQIHCSIYANARTEYHSRSVVASPLLRYVVHVTNVSNMIHDHLL